MRSHSTPRSQTPANPSLSGGFGGTVPKALRGSEATSNALTSNGLTSNALTGNALSDIAADQIVSNHLKAHHPCPRCGDAGSIDFFDLVRGNASLHCPSCPTAWSIQVDPS